MLTRLLRGLLKGNAAPSPRGDSAPLQGDAIPPQGDATSPSGDPTAPAWTRALAAYKRGDWAEAERDFAAVPTDSAQHAHATLYRASCLANSGRGIEAARLALGVADKLSRERSPPAGWTEAIKEIVDHAGHAVAGADLAQCEREVAAHDDAATHLGLGTRRRQHGDLPGAETALRRAVTLASPPPSALASPPSSALAPDTAFGQLPFLERRLASLLAIMGRLDEADALYARCAASGLPPQHMLHLAPAWLEEAERKAAQASHAPQLQWRGGEPQPAASAPLVLYVSGDSHYLERFAWPLINSAHRHAGQPAVAQPLGVHVHAVNPTPGLLDALAARCAPLFTAQPGSSPISFHASFEHTALPEGDPAGEAARVYYTCARLLHLPAVMRHYQAPVLMLDLDQLVLGDVSRIADAAAGADVGLLRWHPHAYEPWDMYSASALWLSATPGAQRFAILMAAYVRRIIWPGVAQGISTATSTAAGASANINVDINLRSMDTRIKWFLDQCAIFAAHAHCAARGTRFAYLPPSLMHLASPGAGAMAPPEAVLWTAVASLREKEPLYSQPPFTDYA